MTVLPLMAPNSGASRLQQTENQPIKREWRSSVPGAGVSYCHWPSKKLEKTLKCHCQGYQRIGFRLKVYLQYKAIEKGLWQQNLNVSLMKEQQMNDHNKSVCYHGTGKQKHNGHLMSGDQSGSTDYLGNGEKEWIVLKAKVKRHIWKAWVKEIKDGYTKMRYCLCGSMVEVKLLSTSHIYEPVITGCQASQGCRRAELRLCIPPTWCFLILCNCSTLLFS